MFIGSKNSSSFWIWESAHRSPLFNFLLSPLYYFHPEQIPKRFGEILKWGMVCLSWPASEYLPFLHSNLLSPILIHFYLLLYLIGFAPGLDRFDAPQPPFLLSGTMHLHSQLRLSFHSYSLLRRRTCPSYYKSHLKSRDFWPVKRNFKAKYFYRFRDFLIFHLY